MVETFSHMIPVTEHDRALIRRLAGPMVWPAEVVQVALDWAIAQDAAKTLPADAAFRPEIQIHVHLEQNYLVRFDYSQLALYLHLGINHYFGNYRDGLAGRKDIDFWTVNLVKGALRAIYRWAFALGRDVRAQISEEYRAAIISLMADLRGEPNLQRTNSVEVPVDPETRGLYSELSTLAARYGWDVDQLIEVRMNELVRRRE